jgi:hypothetical protein
MLASAKAYNGFAVDDLERARECYGNMSVIQAS